MRAVGIGWCWFVLLGGSAIMSCTLANQSGSGPVGSAGTRGFGGNGLAVIEGGSAAERPSAGEKTTGLAGSGGVPVSNGDGGGRRVSVEPGGFAGMPSLFGGSEPASGGFAAAGGRLSLGGASGGAALGGSPAGVQGVGATSAGTTTYPGTAGQFRAGVSASGSPPTGGSSPGGTPSGGVTGSSGTGGSSSEPLPTDVGGSPPELPPAGNPDGRCEIPAEARAEDTSNPTSVVGDGTPASCTGSAFVQAVAKGGIITFDCGSDPITITLDATAKIVNNTGPKIVIDGGGKVTLSGGGKVRILYQNTCDQNQVWTTEHCENQDHPQLTVQNITMTDGNATNEPSDDGGGGAIFARGGRFKVVNSRFFRNTCDPVGPVLGGGAIRVLMQYQKLPVYVVHSTFGGEPDLGNRGSNGGGISGFRTSYTVINSLFRQNRATGRGANPPDPPDSPGGGSGGAIHTDGETFTLDLCGTQIADNQANEEGGGIYFVSNDGTGSLVVRDSSLAHNRSHQDTRDYPGLFVDNATPQISNSDLEP